MLEITTAIFLTLAGSAFYHLLPRDMLRLRMVWVAILSFVIVFAHYPVAALLALALGVCAWTLALAGRQFKTIRKYGPFSLIGVLLFFGYEDFFVATDIYSKTLVQFGMSFYVLRLYLALRTAQARAQMVGLEEFLVIALFFPIFPAGPICAQEAFTRSAGLDRPLRYNYLLGMLRIGIGILALYGMTVALGFLIMYVSLMLPNFLVDWEGMGWFATYALMILKFAHLYANFVGYTEIAIGLGLFFGFQIPENFRYPFLATNIQNFWQRWHLSLSKFITTQIYLPLMLTLRKPRLCMFLAFVLAGMWHHINLQYLVWGMGHGAMLVAYMTLTRTALHAAVTARINPRVWKLVSWLTTISLVAYLSAFANEPTWSQSLAFSRSLFMGG